MHLSLKLTYLLVTLYINNKTVSLWERAKHPYTGDVASEQQTTRTAPEDFDGYSAAPAGQRVVDVKTSAVRGVGLKAGIAEDLHADNLRTRSGYRARFSPGRCVALVIESGGLELAKKPTLRHSGGLSARSRVPTPEGRGCSGETTTPLPRPSAPASIVGFGGLAAGLSDRATASAASAPDCCH
jgi:hypothetical protein